MRRPCCSGRAFRLSSAATMLAGLPLKLSSIRVAPATVCSTPRPVMMPTSSSCWASAAGSRPAAWTEASAANAFCSRCGAPGVRPNAICLPPTSAVTSQLSPRAVCCSSRTSDAPPKRTILPVHSGAFTSTGNTSTPSLGSPRTILTFSRRIASRLPSFSRCTGCTLTTSATVGRVSSLNREISPTWFMPISTTQTLAPGSALLSVSGTPQKLLKLLGLA